MKTLLMALILTASSKGMAQECQDYQTKIIFDQKTVIEKEVLCKKKTADNTVYYVSKSCAKETCDILVKKKSAIKIKNYTGNMGSPGFKLCFAMGGVPQIFEFQALKNPSEWESSERCFFGKDFVEISLLMREWKGFVNR